MNIAKFLKRNTLYVLFVLPVLIWSLGEVFLSTRALIELPRFAEIVASTNYYHQEGFSTLEEWKQHYQLQVMIRNAMALAFAVASLVALFWIRKKEINRV